MARDRTSLRGSILFSADTNEFGIVNEGFDSEEGDQSRNVRAASILSLASTIHTRPAESSCWKARDTFVLLSFLGLMITYAVRVCLSIAIVSLVSTVEVTSNSSESELSDTCPLPEGGTDNSVVEGEFDWSDATVSIMLSAFFYGYTVTNFLGGRAAEYLGGKLTFMFGVVVPCILTLLSPLCINISEYLFIALRVLEGMAQGLVFPSIHYMIAAWIPPRDKAKFASIIFSGTELGTVIAMGFGGFLCNSSFLGGWPATFYVFGSMGVLWGIPWFLLTHSLPEHHPRISSSELEYILLHRHYVMRDKAIKLPWRQIATSLPFWAIMGSSFCYSYSFYTLLTELPTYFNNVLHMDLNKNALGSSLPYILMGFTCVGWGFFADFLHRKNVLSVIAIRKLSTATALYGSAVCLVVIMWVDCNILLAIIVMSLSVGFQGPINSGAIISEQDIAPNLSGSLKGLTNTLGSAMGFIAPAVTGAIVGGNQTVSAWNNVFLVSALLNFVFCSVFLVFGTDKVQEWNYPDEKKISISSIPEPSGIEKCPQASQSKTQP